jgi:hypothetical protein
MVKRKRKSHSDIIAEVIGWALKDIGEEETKKVLGWPKPREIAYIHSTVLPRKIKPGLILVHNHARHGLKTKVGVNGFRAWWELANKLSDTLEECDCGWSGLVHYRVKRGFLPRSRKGSAT